MHKMPIAIVVLFGILAVACSACVSHRPAVAEDAAEQRVSLHAADGHRIGIIVSAVACAADVYLGDASGAVLTRPRHLASSLAPWIEAQRQWMA